jgi:cation diffusion facilitator family transporter
MAADEELDLSPLVLQEEPRADDTRDWRIIANAISTKGREQQVILFISVLLSVFFFVLLLHALTTKSTGFIPVAFIQLMHAILLFVVLVMDYYSTLGPDDRHTYGYARSTIICSFAVSLAIILYAFSLLLEALKKFLGDSMDYPSDPPSLLTVIPHILGLVIYACAALLLRSHASNPTQSRFPHLHAAFLVFASGAMHSLAHLAASLVPFLVLPEEVTKQAPPLFHGLVALFIIERAKLLLWPSFLVLMQATPEKLLEVIDPRSGETVLDRMIREASHFEGVLECKSGHFWSLTFTEFIGSLHIRAKNDANEQHIIMQAHSKFDPVVSNFTAQVEKDHWDRLGRSSSGALDEAELGQI